MILDILIIIHTDGTRKTRFLHNSDIRKLNENSLECYNNYQHCIFAPPESHFLY